MKWVPNSIRIILFIYSALWELNILFYRSKLWFLEDLGDIDFFLETYHSLLSHCVWVLVSAVLINHKVWEREQFEDLARWAGSTLQKWNHQLEKRLEGGKDSSRTRSLVARVADVQAHNASTQLPKSCGRVLCYKPQGKEFIQHLWKCEGQDSQSLTSARGRSPVMQIQGLSLENATREAREGREGVTKAF